MAPHLVEEAHEALEAVETGSDTQVAEEAGDILMVVALICRIGQESGRFDLAAAADAVGDKLVRRHPHVFGDAEARSSGDVLRSWEAIKQAERRDARADDSALAGIPASLPALQRAARACGKAVSAGFRWNDVRGAFAKVEEELEELRRELPQEALEAPAGPALGGAQERVGAELGDLLLAAAFFGRYLGLDPERLCRDALRRFEARFRSMEAELGGSFAGLGEDALRAAWERAKAAR
jgi:MazG family protein